MKALYKAIALGPSDFSFAMFNPFQLEEEFVRMTIRPTTVLTAVITENRFDLNPMLLAERQHIFVEYMDSGYEKFAGKESAQHAFIAKELNLGFFFAHSYHSWERGLNKNTIGLIRQYFPKSTNFEMLTNEKIQNIMDRLNNRPRKTLGFEILMID